MPAYKLEAAEQSEIAQHIDRGSWDFPYFCSSLLGITLNSGQLQAWERERKKYVTVNIMLCGNRSGKTVKTACKHIWKLYYKKVGPGKEINPTYWNLMEYKTMNCAPHSNQTKIMLRTMMQILRGKFVIKHADGTMTTNRSLLRYFIDADGLSNPEIIPKQGPYELHFANASSFYAYTLGGSHGDAIQGDAFAYASYDEFGRSKDPEKEFVDISTRLGDWVGELDIITTPDENNVEASEWLSEKIEIAEDERSGFRYMYWSTLDNEFMTKESVDVILVGKSEQQKRQILKGNIVKTSKRYFPLPKVSLIFDEKRANYALVDFEHILAHPEHMYFGGLDTSGLGKDAWSFYVIDYTVWPFKVVYKYTSATATPTENKAITRNIINQFYDAVGRSRFKWQIDFTSEGGTIIFDDLRDLDPIPYRFGIEKGTGKNKKVELLDTFRRLVQEEGIICPYNSSLETQLRKYKGPKDDKEQKTDEVMALALASFVPFEERLGGGEDTVVDIE